LIPNGEAMLAQQFHAAADGARTLAATDEVARLLWRALGEGQITDAAAEAISEAVEARRAAIKGARPAPLPKPPTARRRPVSPDKAKSLERRRRLAAGGTVPGRLAASFTQGEIAALSVIGREVQRSGRCELFIDAIAALAGVSRSTVQNALRQARATGLVTVTERRRRGAKSLTNVIEVVSREWSSWLKLGAKGHRVQNNKHHEIQNNSNNNYGSENPVDNTRRSCRAMSPSGIISNGGVHTDGRSFKTSGAK
jgi:hypothetical protein